MVRSPLNLMVVWILVGACAPESADPAPSTAPPAMQILEAAARTTGADRHGEPLQLKAEATVTGPADPFRTVVYSSSDGRVRMEQIPFNFLAGSGRQGGWFIDPETGEVDELGDVAAFVTGHELHLLALRPLSRLLGPRLTAPHPDDPQDAVGVALSLITGDSLVAYFSLSDTLPVGLRVAYTQPNVVVTWSDWVERAGLRVFTRAAFRQGDEVFTYVYDDLHVGALPDSVFEPPAGAR